ncbi:hypothetical protein COLO4_30913 [Corchorus olitorius]|uniref:Uncharacterized protein n=1 Tax=Corchorus olitorius TaxID=93759 RepID=A0A1R3H6G0_9ROSI|nr:hypothetical protein COLO4_30913 [Corchorus olitorius]
MILRRQPPSSSTSGCLLLCFFFIVLFSCTKTNAQNATTDPSEVTSAIGIFVALTTPNM